MKIIRTLIVLAVVIAAAYGINAILGSPLHISYGTTSVTPNTNTSTHNPTVSTTATTSSSGYAQASAFDLWKPKTLRAWEDDSGYVESFVGKDGDTYTLVGQPGNIVGIMQWDDYHPTMWSVILKSMNSGQSLESENKKNIGNFASTGDLVYQNDNADKWYYGVRINDQTKFDKVTSSSNHEPTESGLLDPQDVFPSEHVTTPDNTQVTTTTPTTPTTPAAPSNKAPAGYGYKSHT